jgi:transposase-like protein
MIQYIVPSVVEGIKLERRCPHCHRTNGNIHSAVCYRLISDVKVNTIAQQRMKCPWCGTAWTVRAGGVGHGRQRNDRLISFGVFLYMLGLSYRKVETLFKTAGWKGSKSSIERDVARAGQKAKALHNQAPPPRVRILGVDGTGAKSVPSEVEKMAGQNAALLFFVDVEHERWSLPQLPEEIERLVRRFINCRRGTHWRANQLLQHIERTWPYVGRGPCDPTNNATECVIGLTYKVRAKTMRGFKNWDKVLAHSYLGQYLRGENGVCDTGPLKE